MKIKWRVAAAPTGPYRSFHKRSWPSADYEDGTIAAAVYCDDDYTPSDAKTGKHAELTLRVADHSATPWKWRTVKKKCATLREAKELLTKVLETYPHMIHKGEIK